MSKRAWGVLIACFFTVLIAYGIRYSYGVLLPEMLPALDITKTEAGVIYASYFIAYSILSPVVGILADRFNIRVLLALFVAIMGLGTLLMAYSSSTVNASLYFILAGIGTAACWAPVMSLAQKWAIDKRRGMTLAFIDGGSSLGIIGAGAAVPMIVVASDWRTGWMIMGILAFLIAGLNLLLIRRHTADKPGLQEPNAGQHADKPVKMTYSSLMRNGRFWLIGIAYLFVGASIMVPFTFLSTYAVQELAYPYASATRLITVIGITAFFGKLVLGPLSDTTGRMKIMMLCAVLSAAGTLGMVYFHGLATLILFTAIFGVGYGGVWSMYAAAASDYLSKDFAGSIIGLWTFLAGAGCIFSPIIAGWIADTTGTFTWSFIMSTAGSVVTLLLLLPVWRAISKIPTGK